MNGIFCPLSESKMLLFDSDTDPTFLYGNKIYACIGYIV